MRGPLVRHALAAVAVSVTAVLAVPAQASSVPVASAQAETPAKVVDAPTTVEQLRELGSETAPSVATLDEDVTPARSKSLTAAVSTTGCPLSDGKIAPDADAPEGEQASCARRLNQTPAAPAGAKAAGPRILADTVPEGWSKQPAGFVPTWCNMDALSTYRRMRECHADTIEYLVYVKQTGAILGRAEVLYWEWEQLSNKDRSWKHDITTYVSSSTDLALATFLTGQGWCAIGCTAVDPPGETLTLLTPGSWFRGHWSMSSLGGDDRDTTYIQADTDLTFLNIAAPVDDETVSTSVDFHNRCDSTLPETPREGGCTFNEVTPTLALDKSSASKYRDHALFVEDAQATTPDHYGARGRGEPLQRMTDEDRQEANRNESCRGFASNFPNDSCDEYPYASTYQGANEIGRARTAVGHVLAAHNSLGGSKLQSFTTANRVIDGDGYWVDVVEGSGEDHATDQPPTVDAGEWVYGDEGSALPVHGSADDEQGPPEVTWSYETGDVDTGASCTFSDVHALEPTLTCTDDGSYILTITADDGVNHPVSASTEARIRNVPPTFRRNPPDFAPNADKAAAATGLAPAPWTLFRVGKQVTLSTPYDDPGSNDTQECVVTWDDGTPAQTYAGHETTCDATHTYTHAGMYSIKLSTTDDDGDADTWSTMIVVYDPNAGWNNSDGSMLSAPGAWAEQPSVNGEQWFHLAAKYYPQNDPTVPVGDAQTWLANSSFRFTSADNGVDWLVVTPDGKIASKGRGKLQGRSGDFGYVFYGYDGCDNGQSPGCRPGPDRFRVVVWPLSEGQYPTQNAVYDNRAGADYDVDLADPAALKSGIVTIHPPQ